jgi:hypothetical protein
LCERVFCHSCKLPYSHRLKTTPIFRNSNWSLEFSETYKSLFAYLAVSSLKITQKNNPPQPF